MLAAQRVVLGLSENSKKVEISILSLDLTKAFDRIPSDLISNWMKSQRRAGLPAGHSVGGGNVPSAGDQRGPERPVLGPLFFVSAGLVYPGKAALRSHSVSGCPGPAVF